MLRDKTTTTKSLTVTLNGRYAQDEIYGHRDHNDHRIGKPPTGFSWHLTLNDLVVDLGKICARKIAIIYNSAF